MNEILLQSGHKKSSTLLFDLWDILLAASVWVFESGFSCAKSAAIHQR
jgi:hypothetical protein